MVFKKGHPNYGGKGYLYIIESNEFVHAMGTQWVCFKEVKPTEVIELEVDDYLEYCVVLSADSRKEINDGKQTYKEENLRSMY